MAGEREEYRTFSSKFPVVCINSGLSVKCRIARTPIHESVQSHTPARLSLFTGQLTRRQLLMTELEFNQL